MQSVLLVHCGTRDEIGQVLDTANQCPEAIVKGIFKDHPSKTYFVAIQSKNQHNAEIGGLMKLAELLPKEVANA